MKTGLLLSIIFMLLHSCNVAFRNDRVKRFIPGVYARHYADEYSDSYDTIEIRLIATGGSDGYTITKRTQLQKQTDDGKTTQEYQIKRWKGFYDDKTKTIWLPSTGKRIYFDPAKNELKTGTQPYKKLR